MMLLILFLQTLTAWAADPAPLPAKQIYSLSGLRPGGFSQYNLTEAPGIRQYLRFQGSASMHYLIYEEQEGSAPRKDISNLRQAMNSGEQTSCDLELECDTKAFCTGDCRNFYYELRNVPKAGRNQCVLRSFDCAPSLPVITPPAPAVPTGGP